MNYIPCPSVWIAMHSCQSCGQLFGRSPFQKRPGRLDGSDTHPCRATAGEEAIDHLFPVAVGIAAVFYGPELCQATTNFVAPFAMDSLYFVNC